MLGQKTAVVFITLLGILIHSEAFAACVVIVVLGRTCPVMAFDAKVVVALSYEIALSCSALKESLGKSDTCGYAVTKHLLDGEILILVDVCLIALIPFHLCATGGAHK